MAHDIRITQGDLRQPLDPPQSSLGVDQSAGRMRGQIDLRGIARDDDLRSSSHAREKHLHLRDGRVLRLVQDDERVVERPSAHVGQRNDLDQVLIRVPADLVEVHHLAQRVQQRTQVRVDLGLQVAGQVAEALARLDRRAHQHDLANPLLLERRHGHGHGQVGLAGAGRARAKNNVVLRDGLYVAGLSGRAGHDLAPGVQHFDRRRRAGRLAGEVGENVRNLIGLETALPVHQGLELLENLGGARHGVVGTLDADLVVPRRDIHGQRIADFPQMLVASAEQRKQRLRVDHRDGCFCHSECATTLSGPEQPERNVLLSYFITHPGPARIESAGFHSANPFEV